MIMEYRGVEIDGSILKSEKDVDEFLERLTVDRLKVATEIFAYKPTMDMSIYIDELSEKLVNKFGYTWEKIDELEKSCLKNVEKENCETIDLWKGEMFVIPSIDVYSRAEKKTSMIITDPKMELYKCSKETLEKRGYIVHLLNLYDPLHSMGFNPLEQIKEE